MKILILANNDVGLFQFRRELIEELLKSNEVFVALPYGELVEPLMDMGCRFLDTSLERRGMNPIKDGKLFLAYRKLLKRVNPDLVITYTIKPNVYGGFASRLAGIPYAVNITGLGTAFQSNGMLRKAVTQLYKLGCKRAKVVFFENSENRQVFIDEHIVRESQTCLLNGAGVNLKHYKLADYPTEDKTKFLFIGRVMKEKGVDELFAAMRMLRKEGISCTLDVLGNFDEDYSGVIRECEAEGWLCYHGYQKDVRPFIENCHCFVLPSWHEGMANTNLECAASGRPVITSNIHGCMEAVEDGVTGFLAESKNAEDLFLTMKRFCQLGYEERKAMGLAGRKRMEELFDKEKVVRETIQRLKREVPEVERKPDQHHCAGI